ncbi:MAG: TonB-dependent receptor [Rikenellaceae bacterium]
MEYIKNRMLQRIAMLCFLLLCNLAVVQAATVSGTVVSATDNQPIIGAAVTVEGTTIGTATDLDGKFTISNAPDDGVLMFSYLGCTVQTHPVVANKTYNIALVSDVQSIDEVVVVGYGSMRKLEVTGSVARVDAENISKMNTADVGSALQGQVAGVTVQMSTGQPGDLANIQIRGISSITGSNQPLYVVDGIPYDGDPGLSPNEIESLDILKDAASAAIYGTRGSGGVILITTKGGSEGKMKVDVDVNYGVQMITSRLFLTDAAQSVFVDAMENTLDNNTTLDNSWHKIEDNQTGYADNSNMVDFLEENLQPIVNANVTLSGGSNGFTYGIVGNYFNQEGVIINSGYERFNIRANTALKRNNWTFSANMSSNINNKEIAKSGIYNQVYSYSPTSPVFSLDFEEGVTPGTYDAEKTTLGTILAKFKEENNLVSKVFNGNFSIGYEFIEGLSFTSTYGLGYTSAVQEIVNPIFTIYDSDGEVVNNANTRSGIYRKSTTTTKSTWENMINYDKSFGKHNIKATLVYSQEQYTSDMFSIEKYDLISNDLFVLSATTGESVVDSWKETTTLVGMLGRVQYNFDDRYMLSVSARRDGSSRFATSNRWGTFPSVSAGWNISEEEFFEPMTATINTLKLRGSFGTTGNQNFDDYAYASSLTTAMDYAFSSSSGSNSITYGTIQTAYANSDVKWETTQQANLGIDMTLLNSRLSITADVYTTNKRDMLMSLTVPASAGTADAVVLNVGDMENKGVELALGWRDRVGELGYNLNLTASRNVNTITEMSGTNKQAAIGDLNNYSVSYLIEGQEAGAFMLYPTDGIINTDEKLIEYSKMFPEAVMGDLMYVDTDGNGSIGDEDRVYYGSGAPEVELGLNMSFDWKGFDLSMQWYSSIGNEVINGSKYHAYRYTRHQDMLYSWTDQNIYSTIPRISAASHMNYYGYSDYWIEDGSYLRLNNIIFGYTFANDKLNKIGLNKLRLYVAADNIWTITGYTGYNPGVGNDGLAQRGIDEGTYPVSAQIRGGVQISF